MELIETKTVGSGGASYIEFTSIPQTYTDLLVKVSVRANGGSNTHENFQLDFNGSGSNQSYRDLFGANGSVSSGTSTSYINSFPAANATANTFSNAEWYIPNYTSSNYKSISMDNTSENNASNGQDTLVAGLWSSTSAITSIRINNYNSNNFAQYSTASLYGISNVTSGSKATGGIVSSDGTYWYHMFPYSGTFTPTSAISADILSIAGGGGGGGGNAAGGGAGGLLYLSSQSLTATGYSVTVGGGGAGGAAVSQTGDKGSSGSNSQFGSLTAAVGGGGGGGNDKSGEQDGRNGGSGGGGGSYSSVSGTGGTGTSGQGNAGGAGSTDGATYRKSGGGGGAGAAAANAGNNYSTDGGVGVNTYSSWANATQTGVNGYYAGGGAAGPNKVGGLGGGGSAPSNSSNTNGNPGVVNTGGGGSTSGFAASGGPYYGGAGGSGLVIIRYAI